jgi:hypothetical protein
MAIRNERVDFEQAKEMNLLEFENYIWGSDLGLMVIDEKWHTTIKSPDEIAEELLLDDVREFLYIESDNNVKIIFNNGCINLVIRV